MDGTIRVLHVEDESDFADVVAEFLERADDRLAVRTATGVDEGLDRIADGGVDCVVSDYDMPGRDGIEFLEAVREEWPNLPFLLYTGEGSEAVASEAISAGVTDYLRKGTGPEQYDLLANRIVEAVEHRRARDNYREVFEKVPDGIVVHDAADGGFVDMNDRYAEMFGYDRAELLDAGLEAVLPDESPYAVEDARRRVREAVEGGTRTVEWPGIAADGERFWTEVHLAPVRLHGRERVLAIVREITERKERERRLREENAFNEVALDSVVDFYWVLDTDGYVVDWSDDDGSVTGFTPDEAVGMHATEFFPEHERAYIDEKVAELKETGEVTAEADFRTGDGEVVPYRFDGTVLTDDEGTVERLCGLGQDVSERKARERELSEQNERLEAFASTVSHDLRNPLTVAEGRLDLARAECDSEHLDRAADAIGRSQALIDDLLTLARGEERASEIEEVDLGDAAEGCWANVETDEATLVTEAERTVRADVPRLERALENLFRNAVEHGGDDVTVTVGDQEDGFYVADDGQGIPVDEREAVFESGYSTSREGTGFGLNIVEDVADAHGWEVDVTEAADGGARFEVTSVDWAE